MLKKSSGFKWLRHSITPALNCSKAIFFDAEGSVHQEKDFFGDRREILRFFVDPLSSV